MSQIIPITELRNTNEISERCHSINKPIHVTKNGYGDLVVMSEEVYEELILPPDYVQQVLAVHEKIKAGEVKLLDGKTVLSELRAKYVR